MGIFEEELLPIYRNDVLIQKIEEIYEKWKNHSRHSKIVKRQRNIYWYDLDDKFIKFPNLLFECLTEIDFKHGECFKLYLTIYKNIQRNRKHFMSCKKMYLVRQVKINRMTLHRSISELKEKRMLLEDKSDDGFIFILNIAPLTWIVNDSEKEGIEKEVEREVRRLHEKWIEGNTLSQ